jgi:hypothetical protein
LKADTSKIELAFAMVDSALPEVSALNKSGSQKMKMIFHPGSSKYEFSAFKISYTSGNSEDIRTIRFIDEEFRTGNGISLGMKKNALLKITGNPSSIREDNESETWFYAIRDQKSPLLKKYNQWKYFAAYKFNESDELVEFQFGFEYP